MITLLFNTNLEATFTNKTIDAIEIRRSDVGIPERLILHDTDGGKHECPCDPHSTTDNNWNEYQAWIKRGE